MAGSLSYKPFSFKAAIQLAAPPTWVASIGPCVVGLALALCTSLPYALNFPRFVMGVLTYPQAPLDLRSAACFLLMLACGVLMQSAINTLNDYQDFKSGLDTAETVLDETDASLVYNQINPKSALRFALALLAVAAVCGGLVVCLTSTTLLVWGLIAAAAVALYAFGPKPISSLPLGEIVSGTVMGGILTCGTYYAMTLYFSWAVAALALIPIIGVAQVMLTNNTCDIERDLEVGRKTLPGIIGARRSAILNATLAGIAFAWLILLLAFTGLFSGIFAAVAGLLLCILKIDRLYKGPYDLVNRRVMMSTVTSYNKVLYSATAIALVLGGIGHAFY